MSYVKHILLSNEHVLYEGHVHPKVLVKGVLWLGFAAWLLSEAQSSSGHHHSVILKFAYYLASSFPSTQGFYNMLQRWQDATPNVSLEMNVLALGIALWGFTRLMNGLLLMQTTELVITDQRVIAKMGVMTVVTTEMDVRRIAGVTIDQTFLGRLMGYGHIFIRGFTSSIGGMPVMVNPHLIEKYINQ